MHLPDRSTIRSLPQCTEIGKEKKGKGKEEEKRRYCSLGMTAEYVVHCVFLDLRLVIRDDRDIGVEH